MSRYIELDHEDNIDIPINLGEGDNIDIDLDSIEAIVTQDSRKPQVKVVTPSKQRQSVIADEGFRLEETIVEPIPDDYIDPQGEVVLVENGRFNVRNYSTALVDIPMPSGEILIEENNKTYDVADYETAKVKIPEKPQGEFYVITLDFYGNIIDEQRLNNGDVYTLPTPPTDDKLDFLEWSSSQEIVNNQVVIDNNNVMIGAIGKPKSGLHEFDIEVNKATGKNVICNMVGNKNWGDGTQDNLTTHEYADYGEYTITCDGDTLASYMFGNGDTAYVLKRVRFADFTNTSSGVRNVFRDHKALESITFSGMSGFSTYLFYNCYALKSIIFPIGSGAIPQHCMSYCYSLKELVIPYTVSSCGESGMKYIYSLRHLCIPKNANCAANFGTEGYILNEHVANYKGRVQFTDYYNLEKISIGENITNITLRNANGLKELILPEKNSITGLSISYCSSLERVKMPKDMASFGSTFSNCTSLKIIDFSNYTIVPALTSTTFGGGNRFMKIVVPDALYDEWIVATNWSTKADYIYKASEVNL